MAEDQSKDRRRDYLKELVPWTKLFSAFKIALDPKKLILAAGGILVMSLGWYVLSVIFFSTSSGRPQWNASSYPGASGDSAVRKAAFQEFKRDRHQWDLLYEMAGTPPLPADSKNQVPQYVQEDTADRVNDPDKIAEAPPNPAPRYLPFGRFRIMPWFEDRGPNPYLLVTGNVPEVQSERGVVNWFITDQIPVLLEPLVKFFQPIVYLFDPAAGFKNRIYLVLVILWSLATWAFFGGAITRIAAVQVARTNERVGLKEAVKFVWARYKAYLAAPVFALLFLAALTVILFLFGLLEAWTWAFGDIVFPILWPIVLLIGLIMAVVLVGLVGWPLMYTTISAEGSDSFDAISRSYSYVYQAPWHYIWYSLVALVYGAIVVFFVVFMGSLTVYMGKWAVNLAPTPQGREPSYLFRWAPTSFGWRDLLLNQSPHAKKVEEPSPSGRLQKQMEIKTDDDNYKINEHNNFAAFVVSVWLYLFFLLIVGFGYSYFWSATTIIYLLMRLKVDDTETDEIHLEEEPEPSFPPPGGSSFTPPGGEQPKTNQTAPQMVETPQLRTPAQTPVAVVTPGASPGVELPKPSSQPDGSPPSGGMH